MLIMQQDKENMRNTTHKFNLFLLFGLCGFLFVGCQSQTPNNTHKGVSKEQVLNPIRMQDGVQDIHWEIVQIQGQKAKFFAQTPYLSFRSQFKQIQGSTGCNTLSGKYQIETAKRQLDMNAQAGHGSCDNALAQEADLLDVLQATTQFQLSGKFLYLKNRQGQTLLQAQKK